ncbi:putative thioredoxin domain-containing protein [Rutstroemia sp. NJR-2017a BVV2]|nr:putative thioredoxin domain-containing protein [Rutstroemia sp. NJR-2017a BVV2]
MWHQAGSDDEDALIASLEDSPAMDAFREQRIQQLHSEFTRAKAQKNQGFGNYTEIKEEKALMDLTTEVKFAVVHFSKDDFNRCGIMDTHLAANTRFLKIDVENAPFLVTKLKVQILPCVLAFIDGAVVDRIVGFEGLGYTPDTFTTKDLESRLLSSGVVKRQTTSTLYADKAAKKQEAEMDDDDDWD